jgi:hypothetical protein
MNDQRAYWAEARDEMRKAQQRFAEKVLGLIMSFETESGMEVEKLDYADGAVNVKWFVDIGETEAETPTA